MREKVFSCLEKWHMTEPGMRIVVGLSGGADSVALLLLLSEYRKKGQIEVEALHVHHGIRGETADRDQAFCEAFCRERGIPLKIVKKDVPEMALGLHMSLEEAGREARYEAFEEYQREHPGSRTALAHHQNDQAETMLFRLMRGTGLRGLRGMEPVRLPYIRPLLCVTKEEILEFLKEEGISWVEDESNQELSYTRNKIRHLLLTPMEQIWPGSVSRMARTAEQLRETEEYLLKETEKACALYAQIQTEEIRIRLAAFEELHPAMQKRMVLSLLEQLMGSGKDLEAVHAEQLVSLSHGKRGGRTSLPGGAYAELGYKDLLLRRKSRKKTPVEYQEEVRIYLPENFSEQPRAEFVFGGETFLFSMEKAGKMKKIPNRCYTKWFDYDKIRHGLVIRTRRPGDCLANGEHAHKKLKDYLIDSKVPREKRDGLILLADGNQVVWIVGMRISEDYKVTEQTKTILKVQIKNREE